MAWHKYFSSRAESDSTALAQPLPAAGTQVEAAIAYAEIAAVRLLPGEPRRDHRLLALHFGAAVIGIAIPNSDARKLGQTLITANADDPVPH